MGDPFIRSMATVRFISASIECTAAVFMLRSTRVEAALRINGMLGMVGPLILVVTTALGVAGLAGRLEVGKLLLILISERVLLYRGAPRDLRRVE